jgi:hypothetical protein
MTQELTVVETFEGRAEALLTEDELRLLKIYRDNGGKRLATDTAGRFFELFLNGSTTHDIHSLNKAFPYGAILWSRIEERWDQKKLEYIDELQRNIRDRLLKAQLEASGLISDMIAAAAKKHGVQLKKYIQTGDVKDLAGIMEIESLAALNKAIEGLQKLTGADRIVKVKTENTDTSNINVNISGDMGIMSPEVAAQVLAVVAADKRKKHENKN